MRKKTILKIERDLKKRAKKMRLGKKRAGAYVYGTLRKIRGNPRSKLGAIIASDDWNGVQNTLVFRKNFRPVSVGQKIMDFRGDFAVAVGGSAPHKPSSEGKVFVREGRSEYSYYPSVFNLYWIPTEKLFEKRSGSLKKNPGKIHPRIRETLERYGFFGDDEGRRITDKDALQFLKRLYKKIPKNQRTLDGVENAIVRYMGAKERQAYRALGKNPVNEVLEILPQDQILAEYKKGGEGQRAKLMFTSKPMSGMSASQLVRKIGNYNNFSWRRVSPFLGKLHFMNQSLTLPMTFRVGREYSPAIYIENVDMPRYANRLIEYAKKNLKADEATYTPVARRVRLWWD